MTARHIDATDKTDGSHVVKILWNENDGERELTVRMPAAGTDATDRVDVDLLPVPGEDPATTMDDAVAALEGFLGNNKYIHIDGDDVRSVCAGALTTVIRVESGSSTGIVEALDGRFHDSSVASDEVTGAIIAIEGPKSLQLSDATAIVGGVQKRLTDKVEIIWGPEFHRRGRPARHRTARNTTEIKNTTGLHAGKSNIIGMPVALTSTSPHANRWFPCHRSVFYPFIRVNTTRTVRQFGSDSPVVSLKKTGGATQSAVVGFAPDEIRVNIHGCDRANRKHHNHCQNPGFRQYTS